jgi:alpha-soluble NSF attachment protein
MSIICCCDRYDKAIEIYETIAKHSMNNNLLKYSVKGYLLNAGLCQICGNDDIKVENAILRYQVSSPPSSFLVYIDDMTTSIIRLF